MSEIIESAQEAMSIACGKTPAPVLHYNGHTYVPAEELKKVRLELEKAQETIKKLLGAGTRTSNALHNLSYEMPKRSGAKGSAIAQVEEWEQIVLECQGP